MANQTDPYKLFPDSHVVTTIKSVCIFFTFIGNGLVILVVATDKLVRRVPNSHFICSLAVSDFLVGAVLMTTDTVSSILRQYESDGKFISVFMFRARFALFTASIWNLSIISYDRYIFIARHREYSSWMSRRRITFLASTGWLLACFFTSLWQIINEKEFRFPKDVQRILNNITQALSFSLPIIIISIMYVRIVRSLRKVSPSCNIGERLPGRTLFCPKLSGITTERFLLLSVLVSFLYLLWAPSLVYYHLLLFTGSDGDTEIFHVTDWLCYANSMVNPFIYALANGKFRIAVSGVVKCNCCYDTQVPFNDMRASAMEPKPAILEPRRSTKKEGIPAVFGVPDEITQNKDSTYIEATPKRSYSGSIRK